MHVNVKVLEEEGSEVKDTSPEAAVVIWPEMIGVRPGWWQMRMEEKEWIWNMFPKKNKTKHLDMMKEWRVGEQRKEKRWKSKSLGFFKTLEEQERVDVGKGNSWKRIA